MAVGRSDGRTLVIVPEVKGNQCTGLTLLHAPVPRRGCRRPPCARCSRPTAAATTRSKDAVTETEPTFRDDLLGEQPVIELLTEPVNVLADRWRSGSDDALTTMTLTIVVLVPGWRSSSPLPSVAAVDAQPIAGASVIGLGVDLVEVDRFRRTLARTPATDDPAVHRRASGPMPSTARDPTERYAVRFAAKEAVMKALGVGLGAIDWHDVEVVRAASGAPSLRVRGRAAALADDAGVSRWLVSLTHTVTTAEAVVIALVSGSAQ